jgi:hypothetical protein
MRGSAFEQIEEPDQAQPFDAADALDSWENEGGAILPMGDDTRERRLHDMAEADEIIHVEPQQNDLRNSPIVVEEPQTGTDASAKALCYWNGQAYSPGAMICSGGSILQCADSGRWWSTGRHC